MLNTACQSYEHVHATMPLHYLSTVNCCSLPPCASVSTVMLSPSLYLFRCLLRSPLLTLLPVSPSFHHLRSENDDFVVSTPNRSASSSSSWSGPGTSGSAPQSTPRCSTPHTPGSQSHSSGYGTPTGSGLRRKDLSFGFAADSDEGSSLFGTPFGTPRGERGDRSDCDESPGSSTW